MFKAIFEGGVEDAYANLTHYHSFADSFAGFLDIAQKKGYKTFRVMRGEKLIYEVTLP